MSGAVGRDCCLLSSALKARMRLLTRLAPALLSFVLPLVSLDRDEFHETLPDGTRLAAVSGATDGEAGLADAARQYGGSTGGGKAVCFGFPFECVSSAKARTRYMRDILRFFASPRPR